MNFSNYEIISSTDKRIGYGAVLNDALDKIYTNHDVALTMDEDFLLD